MQSSGQLLLALSWANLVQQPPRPDVARAKALQVISQAEFQSGIPAGEVLTGKQVRTIYSEMRSAGRHDEAVRFHKQVVEAQEEERGAEGDDLRGQRLSRSISVELSALSCLSREHASTNDRWNAIQALDQCEAVLQTNGDSIQPGFLARYWLELSEQTAALQLPWATARRAARGSIIDSEMVELKTIREAAEKTAAQAAKKRLIDEIGSVAQVLNTSTASGTALLTEPITV
jgi:hypothetical protein